MDLSKDIKIIISDFDGVFTDGSVYISENNDVQKKLNFKDIMGVSILIKAGYKFAIVSGERSNILDYFKDKFNIEDIYGGIRQKGEIVQNILDKYSIKPSEALYIGDDVNDIPAFKLVKYRIAPGNFNKVLSSSVENLQITESEGGSGALREVVDKLISIE